MRGSSLTGGPTPARLPAQLPTAAAATADGPRRRGCDLGRIHEPSRQGLPRQGIPYGVRGLGGARVGEHAGVGLLHVEHVDGLRTEGVDVRRPDGRGRAGPAPRRPGRRRPGRSAARTSRTVARADASGRTTTDGQRSGRPVARAGRRGRPAPPRSRRTAAAAPPRRGAPRRPPRPRRRTSSCAQARAARTEARCSGEQRGDVGEQAHPVGRQHGHPRAAGRRTPRGSSTAAAAYLLRHGDLLGAVRTGAASPASAARARSATGRGPARPATTTTPWARWPARRPRSASASSVERLGRCPAGRRAPRRSPGRRGRGWSRSRRAAGAAHQQPDQRRRPARRSPSGSRCSRAIGSPATLCSVRPPLPMSCSSAATSSTSGRDTCRISAGGLDAGLDDVPVDGEAVDRRGVRQQPDPLPLREDGVERAGLLEGLPDAAAGRGPAASSRTSSLARLRRPRVGQRRDTPRPAGPRSAGASTTSRSAATAAARSSSVGSVGRAGASGSSTTSPPARATPGLDAVSGPAGGAPPRAGRASTSSTRRQVSRERWVIRRPSSRTCTWAARASSEAEPLRPSSAHSSGATRSVARPAIVVQRGRGRRAAPAGERSRSTWGTSTSQVATRALSTVASRSPPSASLRSGTDTCASSPIRSCRDRTSLRRSGSRSRAVPPPVGEHRRCAAAA